MQKNVLVTGAGRGIGAATAKLFAKNGYSVCINFRTNEEAAQKTAAEIIAAGGTCLVVRADVSREDEVLKLFSTIDDELGCISVLEIMQVF